MRNIIFTFILSFLIVLNSCLNLFCQEQEKADKSFPRKISKDDIDSFVISPHKNKKSGEKDTTRALFFSFSSGVVGENDSTINADDYMMQASIGFWKPAFSVFPISLYLSYIRKSHFDQKVSQFDIHAGTFLPVMSISSFYIAGNFGAGVSIGTYRDSLNNKKFVKNYVMPSVMADGELGFIIDDKYNLGIKGGYFLNARTKVFSGMLVFRIIKFM